MDIDTEFFDSLSAVDFFYGDEKLFYDTITQTKKPSMGAHKIKPPLVTVIITTYKRPVLLNSAINSALDQKNFDDYEIVVVDNEGIDPDIETETSRLIASINSKKIIYYRNFPEVNYRMNIAAQYAHSKYICFLHDDDVLSPYHLMCMSRAITQHPNISYLACQSIPFFDCDEGNIAKNFDENTIGKAQAKKYPPDSVLIGRWPGWLGAWIEREKFIENGGLAVSPASTITNIGDFIFVCRFAYKFGIVVLTTNNPLYYYRISRNQLSASGGTHWQKGYCAEYLFYKYAAKKFHPFMYLFWYQIGKILINIKYNQCVSEFWPENKDNFQLAKFKYCHISIYSSASVIYKIRVQYLYFIQECYDYGFIIATIRRVIPQSMRIIFKKFFRKLLNFIN